jgi:hypothetical protein
MESNYYAIVLRQLELKLSLKNKQAKPGLDATACLAAFCGNEELQGQLAEVHLPY